MFKGKFKAAKVFAAKKKEEICMSAAMLSASIIGSQTLAPMLTEAKGIEEGISNGLDLIKNTIVHIAIPLYGCIAAICIVMMIAASGPKVQQAKDWLVRATIGFVALMSIGAITTFIQGMVVN